MAWNGSGTFARLYNWVSRAANPATKYIDPTSMDAEFDNYKTGLENCLTKTGETTPTANQPMGTYRHTGVGAAAALTDYARAGEVQKGTIFKAASPGGTIDAMTGTVTPTPSLTAGQIVSIIAPGSGDNTVTNPTLALNGGSAVTIKKHQGALVAGDYTAGDQLLLLYDGTNFELLNPKYSVAEALMNRFTTDSTGGATTDFIPFIDESETPDGDNKVLVTDFFANVLANFTAKSVPIPADTVMTGDSAASGAAKISTWQQVWNMITGLTAKSTPVLADSIPVADSAASNAAKYSTLQQIFNALNGLTQKSTPVTADKIPISDSAASGVAKYMTIGNLESTLFTDLLADQAAMEAGSANDKIISPGRMVFHDGVLKHWVAITVSAGTPTDNDSFNHSSTTDNGVGDFTLNFTTAFGSAGYSPMAWCRSSVALAMLCVNADTGEAQTTTSLRVSVRRGNDNAADPEALGVGIGGDR